MISFKGVAVFWLAVTALVSGVNARVSCMDENNNEVPWFFIYKFRNGTEYAYVDKHTPDTKHWPVSSKSIASDEGALANTIGRLWGPNKPKDLIYAVYNDQWGNKTDDGGHTKGVFMFDAQTAVWLIHSVPNFPGNLDDERYEYPTSGERNGQVALCVTFKSGQEKTIAEHLLLQHPNIYAKPRTFKKEEYPHLDRLFNGKFTTARPWVLHDKLYDIEGTEFRSFAKHGNFDKDVYSGLVAPGLESSLRVFTWLKNQKEKVDNQFQGKYKVVNIESLTFDLDGGVTKKGSRTVDHSKWAISFESKHSYVCVGTLNREKTQFGRGGETLCFENGILHNLLRSTFPDLPPSKRMREETIG
ncbi:plancitoxin-1-like isoform X1 [Haemaphysalis longicornis]